MPRATRPLRGARQRLWSAIGSTSYLDISEEHRHVEIGWTWYARPYWRTAVNTEGKYLLLRHLQILHDGHRRSVVFYSLLAEEWPARKVWFKERLHN